MVLGRVRPTRLAIAWGRCRRLSMVQKKQKNTGGLTRYPSGKIKFMAPREVVFVLRVVQPLAQGVGDCRRCASCRFWPTGWSAWPRWASCPRLHPCRRRGCCWGTRRPCWLQTCRPVGHCRQRVVQQGHGAEWASASSNTSLWERWWMPRRLCCWCLFGTSQVVGRLVQTPTVGHSSEGRTQPPSPGAG